VNGHGSTERVQVDYPASVQAGEQTLVIELHAVQPVVAKPTLRSMDLTIPHRTATKSKASCFWSGKNAAASPLLKSFPRKSRLFTPSIPSKGTPEEGSRVTSRCVPASLAQARL
jgi:hypothetical protein